MAGLPWGTWVLLLAAPVLGPAIVLSAYRRFRRRQDEAEKGGSAA